MSTCAFVVHGPPVPKARARTVTRRSQAGATLTRSFTPDKTVAYERLIGGIGRAALSKLPRWRTDGRYAVQIAVYRAARRGDVDNFAKAVLDGLNGVCWRDDSAVTRLAVELYEDKERPRIEVEVTEIEAEAPSAGSVGRTGTGRAGSRRKS